MPKQSFVKILLLLVLLNSCSKLNNNIDVSIDQDFVAFLGFQDTKTENNGMSTTWVENDGVSMIHAVTGTTDYVKDKKFTVSNVESGLFTGTLAEELDASLSYDWFAFYPYNSNVKSPAITSVSFKVGGVSQTGNNSMSHLAGKGNFPLYGKVQNVSGTDYPRITMKNVASVVDFKITNAATQSITVTSISLTVPTIINGKFKFDFSGDEPVLTSASSSNSDTATLTVDGGSAIGNMESADFYMAIAPNTVAAGESITIVVNVTDGTNSGSQTFTYTHSSDLKFSSGKIKTFDIWVDPTF